LPGPEREKTLTRIALASNVAKYLQELSSTAKNVNDLTDQLTKEVSGIEAVVNRLNLGVETNVRVDSWSDEVGDQSGLWRLAYGKHVGKWCLFIEYLTEDRNGGPMADTYEAWFFKDAPRDARIKAVGKIPELLAVLVQESQQLAAKVAEKVTYARELAEALSQTSLSSSNDKERP
jgi:hypothetical protein